MTGFTHRIAFGIVLLSTAPRSAAAQGETAAPAWGAIYETNIGQATASERAAVIATVAEIERILRQVPGLVRPRGFEVMKQVGGGSSPLGDRAPLEYVLWLWFFAPSRKIAGEGMTCIEVRVNRPNGNRPDLTNMKDATGRQFVVEDPIGEPKPGSTVVHHGLRWDTPTADRRSGFVTFTTGGKFPWIPVTREEYLRAQIFEVEGKAGDRETSARKTLEKTEYERWVENAPARKKNRDETIAIAVQMQGRAAAEELRKALEQTEREVTEQLKAGAEEERKRNNEILASPTEGYRLRAEIAAMSQAERASPAMVLAYGPLVAADAPGAQRILAPDPEFWRVRRSRAEVHSITVAFHASLTCGVPAVREALWKAYNTLDWLAFKRIVDRP